MSYIIYADVESLIKKIDGCANNPENSSTTETGVYIPCGYSVPTIWVFDGIENKHTLYRKKDYMKKLCESFGGHEKNIIDFEKKNVTFKKGRTKVTCKVCYICQKRILKVLCKSINYWKVRDHCYYRRKYRGAAYIICNLLFNVPNEIPIGFHNCLNDDYHFIIKE